MSIVNGSTTYGSFVYSDTTYSSGVELIVITAKNNNTNTTVPN